MMLLQNPVSSKATRESASAVVSNPVSSNGQGQNSQREGPKWKTVLKVVLVIVIIAAIIIAGKYFLPKIVTMAATVGKTVGAVAGVATSAAGFIGGAAESTSKAIDTATTLLTKPLIVTAVKGVEQSITNFQDSISIESSSGETMINHGLMNKIAHPFQTIINWFKRGK